MRKGEPFKHKRLCLPWRLVAICGGRFVVGSYRPGNNKTPTDVDALQNLDHGDTPASRNRDRVDNRADLTRIGTPTSEDFLLHESVADLVPQDVGEPLPQSPSAEVFFTVPFAIMQVRGISVGARILWALLSSGNVPPRVGELGLARAMGVGGTAIRYYATQLEKAGLLEVRRGRPVTYRVLPLPNDDGAES